MANIIEILMKQIGAEQVSKSVGGLDKKIGSLTASAAKYTAASGVMLAGAIKLVQAHGQQAAAEAQLEAALGKSTTALTKQASALQRRTKFADEDIIAQQAFLANLEFSEDQIKQMMPVILDLAAATGMDLASATKNVSKTFSGMQGELGEMIPQLKNLTAEEMKAGGAVDLINELFGGQAEVAAEATAGIDQMRMTMGDLAEVAGSKLAPALNTVFLAWSNILQGAPGSEWWEGVALGIDQAQTASQALAMQVGGIDRLVASYDDLSKSELREAFEALGLTYDDVVSKEENLNFLKLTQNSLIQSLIETKKEEKKQQEEELERVDQLADAWEGYSAAVRQYGEKVVPYMIKKAKLAGKSIGEDLQAPVSDLTTDFQRFEENTRTVFEGIGTAAQAAADIIAHTAGEDKDRQILAMRIAQLAAVANTAQGVSKALAAAPPPLNFINAAAVAATGAIQISTIQTAINQARSAATGLDEVFDSPTPIIVGDRRGGEKVTVTPAEESIATPTVILNFNAPVSDREYIRNEVLPQIRDAIRLGL